MKGIPAGWSKTTLGEIRQKRGRTVDPRKTPDTNYELYSVPSFETQKPELVRGSAIGSSKGEVTPRAVLLCKINPRINRVWVVGYKNARELIASTEWIQFPPIDNVDPDFLCYYMQREDFRQFLAMNVSGVGGSLMRVKPKTIEDYPIPLPPLPEQRRIVARIEELFSRVAAGVAALRQAKAQLQRYRQSVLNAAVTGELTKALPCRQAGWREKSFRNISDKWVPEKSEAYFAYVLECDDGSPYKGYTKDLHARINQHLVGHGAKWTKEHPPVALIHFEEFSSEKDALEREKYFKSGSGREWLEELRSKQKAKHEPADELLERILEQRREQWNRKGKYKDPVPANEEVLLSLADSPESWAGVSLDMVIAQPQYGTSRKCTYEVAGSSVLRIPNVINGYIEPADLKYADFDDKEVAKYPIRENDLLMIRSNGSLSIVGKTALVRAPDTQHLYAGYLIRLRPSLDFLDGRFLNIALAAHPLRSQIERKAKSTSGVNNINAKEIQALTLPLPPLAEQHQIVADVEARTTAIDHLEAELDRQITRSNRLRQSTLAAAFSAQL